jgi:hypothetical protein
MTFGEGVVAAANVEPLGHPRTGHQASMGLRSWFFFFRFMGGTF